MKVQCTSNSAGDLPSNLLRPELGFTADGKYSLIVGKEYVVYALTLHLGHMWLYVCDEDYLYYPVWNPSPLFVVTDPRLSSWWLIGLQKTTPNRPAVPIVAFKEWVEDPLFYDRLTEGEPEAVSIFAGYKERMDAE